MAPNASAAGESEVELVEFLELKHHPTWSVDIPDKGLWTIPPPNPYSGFRQFAEELEREQPVLITNYLEEGFDHYFVLAHRAEGFVNLLDALSDNVKQKSVTKKPPLGSWVVALLPPLEGSFKESLFPYLEEIGGILSKPWRGVVVGHKDKEDKVVVYFTDLGLCETLGLELVHKMSDEVGEFPIDAFGTWVTIDTGISEEKRQFYLHDFAYLMLNIVFQKAFVTKVRKVSKMKISVDLDVYGGKDGPMFDLASRVREMQLWAFEATAKTSGVNPSTKTLFSEGRRITLDDVIEASKPVQGLTPEGEIEKCLLGGARLCVKKLSAAKLEKEKKIWSSKCTEYFFKFRPDPTWFPIEGEIFLLRTKDKVNGAHTVVFRRCCMVNRTVRDMDDMTFMIKVESREFSKISPRDMRQAPMELLLYPYQTYDMNNPE